MDIDAWKQGKIAEECERQENIKRLQEEAEKIRASLKVQMALLTTSLEEDTRHRGKKKAEITVITINNNIIDYPEVKLPVEEILADNTDLDKPEAVKSELSPNNNSLVQNILLSNLNTIDEINDDDCDEEVIFTPIINLELESLVEPIIILDAPASIVVNEVELIRVDLGDIRLSNQVLGEYTSLVYNEQVTAATIWSAGQADLSLFGLAKSNFKFFDPGGGQLY